MIDVVKDEKLYLVMDDTANSGKGYYPEDMTEEQKKDFDLMMKRLQEKYNSHTDADSFYSTSNMAHLAQVTADIDSGTAPLTEHELIED